MAEPIVVDIDGKIVYQVREGDTVLAEADTPEEALELAAEVVEPTLPHELGDLVEFLARDAAVAVVRSQRIAEPYWRQYQEFLIDTYRDRLTEALTASVPDAREWAEPAQHATPMPRADGSEDGGADWLRDEHEHATPSE